MAITIRPTRETDAPALYRLWQVLREYNAATDVRITPAAVSESDFTVAVVDIVRRESSAAFVATSYQALLGFVSGGLEANQPDRLPERFATIGYLFVDPAARRQGIAGQLVTAMVGWARTRPDVSHMEMSVLAADAQAAAFWRATGFSPFIERLWMPLTAN